MSEKQLKKYIVTASLKSKGTLCNGNLYWGIEASSKPTDEFVHKFILREANLDACGTYPQCDYPEEHCTGPTLEGYSVEESTPDLIAKIGEYKIRDEGKLEDYLLKMRK